MDITGKITGIKYKVFLSDSNFLYQKMYFVDALMDEAGENEFEVKIGNSK